MYIEDAVRKLLSHDKGTLLEITWENRETKLYELDTFYDSDNNLELEDDNYKEFHLALVKEVGSPVFVEIGTGENIPITIKLANSNTIIYQLKE